MKLNQAVTAGHSITVQSPVFDLTAPLRRDRNRIAFISYDDSSEEIDDDNFDAVVSINIIRRLSLIQIQTKAAGDSWERVRDMPFPLWLQGQSLQIRIDIKDNTYEVYVNGTHLCSVDNKFGNKGITHVQYDVDGDSPALAGQLDVITA